MRFSTRTIFRFGLTLIVSFNMICAIAARSSAQDRWEMSPYRIRVVLVNDGAAIWTENRLNGLSRRIQADAASLFGKLWIAEVVLADDQQAAAVQDLGGNSPSGKTAQQFIDLSQKSAAVDKLIYVSLLQTETGPRVLAFEHDLQFKYFGEPVVIDLSDFEGVESLLFRIVVATFGANARIASANQGLVSVQPRGLLLPVRDAGVKSCQSGAVLQLMRIGQQDAAVTKDVAAGDEVWTFLVVKQPGQIAADCRIASRYDDPLASPPVGSIVARQIRPLHNSTTLQFLNSAAEDHPLVGLKLALAGETGEGKSIGVTDGQGRFTLRSAVLVDSDNRTVKTHLAELVVRCCGQDLLRLPVVVGWKLNLTCRISIDAERFAALGAIERHRATLQELIAKREVGLARAAGFVAANDQGAADQQLKQLQQSIRESKTKLVAAVNADQQKHVNSPSTHQDAHHWKKLAEEIEMELAEARIVLK